MNKKSIVKIERKLASLRARSAGLRRRDLERIAKSLGRRKFDRGKEPTYISEAFPNELRPLTIPGHVTIKRGTALSILNQLEEDVFKWKEWLEVNEPHQD